MKNINDLRNALIANFESVKKGEIDVKSNETLNNTAGKIMAGLQLELKHKIHTKDTEKIKFLTYSE